MEYLTLSVYFGLLLVLGAVFSRFTKNLSDFAKGGSQLTWWMVGMSNLMAGVSAFTFTGNGSSAFEAGPSLLVIYLANVLGFAAGWLYLAHRYRQTRAYTTADIVRERFGAGAEQFGVWAGLLTGPLTSAVQLWALAVFVSSVFGFSLAGTILAVGAITVCYTTSGGAWAVVATDFVQGVVLLGITLLVGILALQAVGGFGGFWAYWSAPRLAADFQWIKASGSFSGDRYTWQWAGVVFFMQLMGQVNLASAGRYLGVKDGREARRAALLAMGLMALGSLVWFLPPMVARMIYETQVLESGIKDPATAAYAVAAKNLLPNGLMGVLIAAMFAATMSSMDSGLNGQTSVIVRNLLPRIRARRGLAPLTDARQLALCRIISLALGGLIIGGALLMGVKSKIVLFEAFLVLGSIIGVPMGLPLLVGVIFRRLPSWSYFAIFGASALPSAWSLVDGMISGTSWTIQARGMWVLIFGAAATVFCLGMSRRQSTASRRRVEEFFVRMETPVDFAREIGVARDAEQGRLIGRSVIVVGALMLLLLLVPNPMAARLQILALSAFAVGIGFWVWVGGRRAQKAADRLAATASRD